MQRFSLGQVNSVKCYWSQVIPQSFCLKEQGDPWDVLMMVTERCCERSESIIPVRDWGSKEVAMEDSEESTKVPWERISRHLEVCHDRGHRKPREDHR